MKKLLYYLPRVLSILIAVLFGVFILEGFTSGFGWADSLAHALTTLLVILATIVAWKWPKVGGFVFVLFGLMYLVMIRRGDSLSGLIFGGVPVLAGILFLIEGFRKSKK